VRRRRALLLVAGVAALGVDASAQGAAASAPRVAPALLRTGLIERHPAFPSRHVAPRDIQVWLPPGYEASPAKRYPVLYLHDGENVFDAAVAPGEWGFDETAQRLMAAGEVAPALIVAVNNGRSRIDDYTPVPMRREGRLQGGGAAAYARFLVDELKPFIDARYRTRPEAAHTAVGGSSLGGLVSMWLLLREGGSFGAALVVSPSVWWGGEQILRELAATPLGSARPRVWLDIGLLEGEPVVAGARRLRDALLQRGWRTAVPGSPLRPSLAYTEAPEAGHEEAAWAARVEGMLRFLFPPQGGR
jgi:predicted alpha/beta superfamily hydrolase